MKTARRQQRPGDQNEDPSRDAVWVDCAAHSNGTYASLGLGHGQASRCVILGRGLPVWSLDMIRRRSPSSNTKGCPMSGPLEQPYNLYVRSLRPIPANPAKPPPSNSNEEGSGTTVTPEMPETRGCFRPWDPDVELIVMLSICSPPLVVTVKKLSPCVSPYVKESVFASLNVTLTTRLFVVPTLNGLRMKSRKVCPGTVNRDVVDKPITCIDVRLPARHY